MTWASRRAVCRLGLLVAGLLMALVLGPAVASADSSSPFTPASTVAIATANVFWFICGAGRRHDRAVSLVATKGTDCGARHDESTRGYQRPRCPQRPRMTPISPRWTKVWVRPI
jgi:hypothetical protein